MIGIPLETARNIPREKLFEWFVAYARYQPDAPGGAGGRQYAIRVGSKTLFSDDTYELRTKFTHLISQLKRQHAKEKHHGKATLPPQAPGPSSYRAQQNR